MDKRCGTCEYRIGVCFGYCECRLDQPHVGDYVPDTWVCKRWQPKAGQDGQKERIADGWCHISKLCLFDAYQKNGFAEKALEYILSKTKAMNGLSLEIRDEGQEGLARFYNRNGFAEVGKRHNMLIFERRKRKPACMPQRARKSESMYESVITRGRWQ